MLSGFPLINVYIFFNGRNLTQECFELVHACLTAARQAGRLYMVKDFIK
jgi:hypothetical protein